MLELRKCGAFYLIIALWGCASPKAPTGGPKDETPPTIITAESTPNLQTNFSDDKITITFDEWFTLKDAASQVVISPLMPEVPKISQKGKSLLIELPDSLREETTYTINFGNAIADLNEGNILENYAFVFSTGAVLDSARLSGKVTDAATLKPADGVWVMLHPAGLDSAVYKRKPDYIAKTNKEGAWSLANVRPDTFDVFVLKDENLNFLYDQVTERIGWLDSSVITDVPLTTIPELFVFDNEKPVAIRDAIHAEAGWLKIVIDGAVPKAIPSFTPPIDTSWTAWDGDTLHVWYPPSKNYAGSVILQQDTSRIKAANSRTMADRPLALSATTGRIPPAATAFFATKVPIQRIDVSRISLATDSVAQMPVTITHDSLDQRKLSAKANWISNARHTLTFLPGAIEDVWGRVNDTLRQSIVINAADQFGDVTLLVNQLDSTQQYVVLIKSGEQVDSRFTISMAKESKLLRKSILPGKYIVEVIEDTNGNGLWDTGDFATRRQPERKKFFPLEGVRAAWELEVNISW
jgi:hypothetical protein